MSVFQTLNQAGHTLIVVTHNDIVASGAKRRVRLRDGRVEADTGRHI
jgi:putative ABC transport system ATP-binding protein